MGIGGFWGVGVLGFVGMHASRVSGRLSNQREKSINFYFIKGSFKKKSIKVWYSKAQFRGDDRSKDPNSLKYGTPKPRLFDFVGIWA